MAQHSKHDIYFHMRMVRLSFFVMAVLLMISLSAQIITRNDFKGIPFLLFGIGVSVSFTTLIVRVVIRWALGRRRG